VCGDISEWVYDMSGWAWLGGKSGEGCISSNYNSKKLL